MYVYSYMCVRYKYKHITYCYAHMSTYMCINMRDLAAFEPILTIYRALHI